jgi:hypothetical protein
MPCLETNLQPTNLARSKKSRQLSRQRFSQTQDRDKMV